MADMRHFETPATWTMATMPLPARFRPKTPWTDDELMAFSAANDGVQVERESDGTIVMMTPAGGESNIREDYVSRQLATWSEQDGRGQTFGYNAGFKLQDGSLLSPDAAWVPKESWLALTREQRERFVPFCPSFVVEVMSPSDSLSDAEVKMERWIANGAGLGWLIDPYAGAVTLFRAGRQRERLERPAVMVGEGPVAGFSLVMARLWA